MGRDRSRDRKKKKRKHDRSRSRDRKKKRRRRSSSSDSDYRRRKSKKSSRKHKKRSRYSSSSSASSRSRTRSRSSSADSNKPLKPLYESTKDILKREKIEAEQQAKQKELEEAKLEAAKKLGKTIETDDGKTEINDVAEEFSTDKINLVTMKRKHRIEAARRNKQGLGKEEEEEKKPKKEKKWNLENDDSDDEEPLPDPDKEENPNTNKMETEEKPDMKEEEEEIDPLDAFMMNLQGATKQDYKKKRPARVKVVRKVETEDAITKRKGEIIESNQDAMEYSDEDREDDIDKKMKEIKALKEKEARRLLDPSKKIKHDEMHYEPFKKDFYIEIQELAELNEIEIKEARLALENIRVRGVDCPAPVNNWSQCGIRKKFLNVMKKQGFEKPTPIQAQAIPAIMKGRDVIGIAKTGSGKTIAFLLPLLRHISHQAFDNPVGKGDGCIGLIMTPTRELAMQIAKDAKRFLDTIGLRVCCVYGGTGISDQVAELKRGAELVVCTPGRMIDMLAVNNGAVTSLRRCTMCILDEADRMFDLGFEPQVRHIMEQIRPDRQCVMFSATFPRDMEVMARGILQKPIEIMVGGRSTVPQQIVQNAAVLDEENKLLKLLELLGQFNEKGSTIIFVQKQEVADQLQSQLMKSGYPCLALHGGIDQYDRDSVITDFKNGVTKILVATSVAARGLDIRDLILVVNFDTPNHYEDYVHRVGRTGRAGSVGHAWTLLTQDDAKHAGDIIKAFEFARKTPPEELKKLWENYKAEMKRLGKKIKNFSGFHSTRGFRFDKDEANAVKEQREMQKVSLGLDVDEDEGNTMNSAIDIDAQIEKKFNAKQRIRTQEHYAPLPVAELMKKKEMNDRMLPTSVHVGQNMNSAIEKAKLINAKIRAKSTKAQVHAKKVLQEKVAGTYGKATPNTPVSAKQIAEQMAAKLNSKLDYTKRASIQGQLEKRFGEGEDTYTTKYEEALEINDFPQLVRFKLCSRDTLNNLNELTDCRVCIRGRYYEEEEPGPQTEDDDPRLFIEIIGESEMKVKLCRSEVTRIVKQELLKIQSRPLSQAGISKARYSVVPGLAGK